MCASIAGCECASTPGCVRVRQNCYVYVLQYGCVCEFANTVVPYACLSFGNSLPKDLHLVFLWEGRFTKRFTLSSKDLH